MRGLRVSTLTRRRDLVVAGVLLAGEGIHARSRASSAPASPQLKTRDSVCSCAIGLEVDFLDASALPPSRTLSLAFVPEKP